MPTAVTKELPPAERDALIRRLQARFEQHMNRHVGLQWDDIAAKLRAEAEKCWSLHEMERTGGEPDVIGQDPQTGDYLFCDCAPESPADRRACCYDGAARRSRKANAPECSATELAEAMGVALLTEAQYHELQRLGPFDQKTSSWLQTPADVRQRGGALFGDYRYGRVFIYHNGVQSYYAARGFRALLRV